MPSIGTPRSLKRLKDLLRERQITYDKLAYNLNTSAGRVCRALNGYASFSTGEQAQIAELLSVPITKLFKGARGAAAS